MPDFDWWHRRAPLSWQEELEARVEEIGQAAGISPEEARPRAYCWVVEVWKRANPPPPHDRDKCRMCDSWLIDPALSLIDKDAAGNTIWLHPECHDDYRRQRQAQAKAALAEAGVLPS